MEKNYKIIISIQDSEDNEIVYGTAEFPYSSVSTFGDCEAVDMEVGKVMRQLIIKAELELPETNEF